MILSQKNPIARTDYLFRKGIHASLYAPSLKFMTVLSNNSIWGKIKAQMISTERIIAKKLSPDAYILFCSLFLGLKKYTTDTQIKNLFTFWGINHFLARSGLHITILIFLINIFCKLLQLPFLYTQTGTVIFLFWYLIFSYASISFIRAFIMTLFIIWCMFFKVPSNTIHILVTTLMACLAYNPFFALALDFQLTFLLTFGLCIATTAHE